MQEFWFIASMSNTGFWKTRGVNGEGNEFVPLDDATRYNTKQQAISAMNNEVTGVVTGFFNVDSFFYNPVPTQAKK